MSILSPHVFGRAATLQLLQILCPQPKRSSAVPEVIRSSVTLEGSAPAGRLRAWGERLMDESTGGAVDGRGENSPNTPCMAQIAWNICMTLG